MTMRSLISLASTLGGALMPTQCVAVGRVRYMSVTCRLHPLPIGYPPRASYIPNTGGTLPPYVSVYNTGTGTIPVLGIDLS